MWGDLRFGLRQFRRNRLFSGVVIALVALGIGANTLIFSLVNELLLKPLPIRDPGNFYRLEANRAKQVRPYTSFQWGEFQVVEKQALFTAAIAEQEWTANSAMPFESGGAARLASTQVVSPNYFAELGVRALAGRVLTESDATATGEIAAVISYQFWQAQFHGARDTVGRQIRVKNIPFRVVGILPREFHSTDVERAPDIRLPLTAVRALSGYDVADPRAGRTAVFEVFARLAPGVGAARAAAAITPGIHAAQERLFRELNALEKKPGGALEEDEFRLAFEPMGRGASQLRTQFARTVRLLMAGVGLLLLAVCANVAGLLLAKANDRRREIAVRSAVGASRGRLVRQLLAEALLLAVPGAVLGGALALVLADAVTGLIPPVRDFGQFVTPQLHTIELDARVMLFAAAATVFCVLAFGAIPAWRGARAGAAALKPNAARHRTFSGVAPVALQAGFSVVLLAAAGLMLRTWWNLDHLDPGFDRAHVVEFTLDPSDVGYSAEQASAFYRAAQERVAALPGVRSTAWASRGVMRGAGFKSTMTPAGERLPGSTFLNCSTNQVTAGYFETMGIAVLAGRGLEARDARGKPFPAVVNQAFVREIFGGRNPIGKGLVYGTDGNHAPDFLVVGVTATAKYRSMREPDPPTLYSAADPAGLRNTWTLYVRTVGAPAALMGAVREAIAQLDAAPLVEAATLEQEIQTSLWQERLVALLAAFFAVIAMALAGIGMYGALAFAVGRRTREIGIRMAMGARVRHIVGTVCAPMTVALGCGLGGGLAASAWLLRFAEGLLFGVRWSDPGSLAAAVVFLLGCAGAAAALPAWRAIRIDPSSALREE